MEASDAFPFAALQQGRHFLTEYDRASAANQPIRLRNLHKPDEMKIDSFQADRAPGNAYKTMNLAGIFVRERGLFMDEGNKGRFYHDGRFKTLLDVVNSYNERFDLKLSPAEKDDLVEYLKSL